MNRLFAAFAVFLSTTGAGPALAAKPVKIDWDQFTIVMPDNPETKSQSVPLGRSHVLIRSWEIVNDDGLYSMTTADYPAERISGRSTADLLAENRNGLIVQLKGQVAAEKTVTLQGSKGTEIAFTSENGDGRARFFVVGHRVYTMLGFRLTPAGEVAAEKFMTSLRLKPAGARSD
jgi:hypothetical protein